jgi:hypothetical protein
MIISINFSKFEPSSFLFKVQFCEIGLHIISDDKINYLKVLNMTHLFEFTPVTSETLSLCSPTSGTGFCK